MTTVNRREVLAGAGVALTSPLVGCSSIGGDGESSDIPSSPRSYPVSVGEIRDFDAEGTLETIEIGSREGVDAAFEPHDVSIWNNGDVPAIELRVIDYDPTAVVHENAHEIPDGTTLDVTLLEPSLYLIEVTVPALGAKTTLRVDCRLFDCNQSVTTVELRANGALPSRMVTTQIGCSSAPC